MKNLSIAAVCAVLILAGCSGYPPRTVTSPSLEQLIAELEEPDLPDFVSVTSELRKMGPAAAQAAPALARAMRYPRCDFYMAAWALMAMGPAAESAIPELVSELGQERPLLRRYAAFVLGTVGPSAKCAVPSLAERLWDADSGVRTAAAGALENITALDLVDEWHELDPSGPSPGGVNADEPEGSITGRARAWWLREGQYQDWSAGPAPTPVELESLLIGLSSFPPGWEVYFPPQSDQYVAVGNIYVDFRATDGSDLAQQHIYLFPDEPSARQDWRTESRGYRAGILTPWETPAELPYESPVADQFRFFCADSEGGPFGLEGVHRICIAVARYGRYVSCFSTWPSPEHMTWTDIERILRDIDRRMAERLAGEGQ